MATFPNLEHRVAIFRIPHLDGPRIDPVFWPGQGFWQFCADQELILLWAGGRNLLTYKCRQGSLQEYIPELDQIFLEYSVMDHYEMILSEDELVRIQLTWG
jgi:hypothetical protein